MRNMLLPYLDRDGREMRPETKPVFLCNETKAQSYARVARYVECKREDVKGLIWIGHCEDCPNFQGYKKYNGVNCAL